MKKYKLLFYDFEVFCEDWMVVIIDYDTKKECLIINDTDKLKRLYEASKDCIFVGYNSRHYDQFIFKGLLDGQNPYRITNDLIMRGLKGYQCVKNHYNYQLNNFDVADGFHSLKQLEAFMGMDIKESTVPFDIQRKLTKEEIEETIKYCRHDVLSTIEVFNRNKDEFNAFVTLIDMFNLPLSYISKTKAQMGAVILEAKKPDTSRSDDWDLFFPDNLCLGRYEFVKEWFMSDKSREKNAKLKFMAYGVETIVGYGGVHSAKKNVKRTGKMINFDINSMYPQTMIAYETLSRNVSDKNKFREIRDLRLEYKNDGKDELSYALKILINSIFGAAGDKYSSLYDERNKKLTCIYGQLFILDLLDKLENHFGDSIECLNVNTDGLMFKVSTDEEIIEFESIIHDWEERSYYTMERDDINFLQQKDVNNYVMAICKNGKVKIKAKGAMVKFNKDLDNDLSIVNDAVRNYLLDETLPEETINNCNDLIKFQKVYKVTGNYVGAYYNDELLPLKVYRVFASKNDNNSAFYKLKKDKSTPDKFSGTPDHVFINNENIIHDTVPDDLDKQFYIELAWNRINQFLGNKKVKKDGR